MSGIALTTPIPRGNDTAIDIQLVGINYDAQRVTVRLEYKQTGFTRDFIFEGAALQSLRQAVSQFSGLRVALLQYLQTLDASLSGSVT